VQPARPAPANSNGKATTAAPKVEAPPLPDDEQVIYEAAGKEFIDVAAACLDTDTDDVKARLHALGYERIPGDKGKRLDAYRRLKADGNGPDETPEMVEARTPDLTGGDYIPAQAALGLADTDAAQAALDSAAGLFD
jgi:hypothetical protein